MFSSVAKILFEFLINITMVINFIIMGIACIRRILMMRVNNVLTLDIKTLS